MRILSRIDFNIVFKFLSFTIGIIFATWIHSAQANASTKLPIQLPTRFHETVYASGLTLPTSMAIAPDGRIFVGEKGGRLRVVSSTGELLSAPFVAVPVVTDGERGLLGIAIDPEFQTNRFIYVYYSVDTGTLNRVSRFTASSSNPNLAEPGSETFILNNIPSISGYHNGGAIHFGPDGKLYIGVGEGHNSANAQTVSNLAGKLLRINKDGTIPSDNPTTFTDVNGGQQTSQDGNRAIWAIGFRNPFSFAIHPTDGTIFVNDVGEASFEEINRVAKAANYGWPACEGPCTNQHAQNPIHSYGRSEGRAITGGVFYSGNSFPSIYQTKYFFADYLGKFIKTFDTSTNQVQNFASEAASPVDLKVGEDGALYYISHSLGTVYKITYTPINEDVSGDGQINYEDYKVTLTNYSSSGADLRSDLLADQLVNSLDSLFIPAALRR